MCRLNTWHQNPPCKPVCWKTHPKLWCCWCPWDIWHWNPLQEPWYRPSLKEWCQRPLQELWCWWSLKKIIGLLQNISISLLQNFIITILFKNQRFFVLVDNCEAEYTRITVPADYSIISAMVSSSIITVS